MKRRIAVSLLFILVGTLPLGCQLLPTSSDPKASGTVFLWIGADKDTYVSANEPNRNFGQNGFLVVAGNQSLGIIKRSYVHFLLPTLPENTVIEEAYLELYHPGKNEDGQRDDINIPVVRAADSWNPLTMTYGDEPNSFPAGSEFSIALRSQAWAGSGDISGIIGPAFEDPDRFHGFVLFWQDVQSLGIEKGFYSNNYQGRSAADMGNSPRLLVKASLPEGKSTDDITLPPFPSDNDLDFAGQEVKMLRFTGGEEWPDEWNVAIAE